MKNTKMNYAILTPGRRDERLLGQPGPGLPHSTARVTKRSVLALVTLIVLHAGAFASSALAQSVATAPLSRASQEELAALLTSEVKPTQIVLPATAKPADHGDDPNGYFRDAPAELQTQSHWSKVATGGWSKRVELSSSGATALRVVLSRKSLPKDAEIRCYAPDGSQIYGPYRPGMDPDSLGEEWWSPVIAGSSFGVDIFSSQVSATNSSALMTKIVYLYTTKELGCYNDVACYPDWAAEARGVARMYYCNPDGTCHNCTGFMINRPANDKPWLFMSANHCISSEFQANTLACLWFFQNATCNGALMPTIQTLGAQLLQHDQPYDVTLLGLTQPPPENVSYLNYDTSPWAVGDPIRGIHHPGGTFKRISFGVLDGSGNDDFDLDGNTVNVGTWHVQYDNGVVEKGSSGSPLFSSIHLVRGVLTGGDASCPSMKAYYGRLDLAYPNFQTFLGNVPNPVYTDTALSGTELGTAASPFRTLYRAANFCVLSGGTISMAPGRYQENLTVNRPMIMTAPHGGVLIGN